MSRERQQYRVELDAGLERAEARDGDAEQRDAEFRIAILADFTGRAARGVVESGRALGARGPVRVDRDDVDAVIARLAPQILLPLGGGAPSQVRFAELDDFHPDRLYDRLPRFLALREARTRPVSPSAPASVGRPGGRALSGRAAGGGSLLDEILGDVPAPPGGAAAAPARAEPARTVQSDALTDFVRRAVTPHVVPEDAPSQREHAAAVDATIGEELRALLHHPAFQSLEAAWRTVDFVVRRLETDSALRIYLVDVSKAELGADLVDVPDPAASGAHRLLGDSWTVVVGLFTFGPGDEDIALLRRLGEVARAAGASFVAGAEPALVGCPSFGVAPDPDEWSSVEVPAWDALRRDDVARHVGLAAPRFLLRLPYGGRDGEPCAVPGFEELSHPGAHEEYLWGNAAALCALLYGEAFADGASPLRPRLEVAGLPLHVIRAGGGVATKPCAEAVLTARAVDRIAARGVMALQSQKDGDAARFHRLQSIAEPLAALAIRTDSTRDD